MTPQSNQPQPPAPPRVSAVVVSRNRIELLRRCLDSLEKSQGHETLQIIVVDNGSTDGSAQLDETDFPNVRFFRLPKNFGLTKALNIGWRAAQADYVLFLHDDTEVEPAAVELLAAVLDERSDVAAVCPLLVDEEGLPAPQLGELPPDGNYRPAEVTGSEPTEVTYPRGAALMLRGFVIKSIRQIDERYGQFGSDADLAAHIRTGARKILLVPDARVKHASGTSPDNWDSLRRADFLLARSRFISKYLGYVSGLTAQIAAIFSSLLSFRLGELRYLLSGQKIDGSQV